MESGSTRTHCVENSLWNRLWTCRTTDCRMNDMYIYKIRRTAYISSLNWKIKIYNSAVCLMRMLNLVFYTQGKAQTDSIWKRVLRKLFGPKREELTGRRRQLHNEKSRFCWPVPRQILVFGWWNQTEWCSRSMRHV